MTKVDHITKALKEIIKTKQPGERLPSERALTELLDASRITIRRALDQLEAEQRIYRVAHVGIFKADNVLYKPLDVLTGFTSEVEKAGGSVKNNLIEFSLQRASKPIASQLRIEEGAYVYKVVRVRKKNNIPLIIDESYFPKDIIPLDETIVNGSIYHYIQSTLNLKMSKATQHFKAVFADEAFQPYLNVDNQTPVLFVGLVGYLEDGRIFEYTKSYKNTSAYNLVLTSYKEPNHDV
jgi:DNA-binding GntR family transcriptional regulator